MAIERQDGKVGPKGRTEKHQKLDDDVGAWVHVRMETIEHCLLPSSKPIPARSSVTFMTDLHKLPLAIPSPSVLGSNVAERCLVAHLIHSIHGTFEWK